MPIDFTPDTPTLDFQPDTPEPVQPEPQDYARSNDPTMLGDIGHLLKTFYEDTKTGLKQAFAPEYTAPNRFDTAVGGALGVDPNTLQKYISTPASQVGGLMMALGGNALNAGFIEPARMGLSRLNRAAGGDESTDISGPASMALGLLAPQGIANAVPNLIAKTARGLTRSGVVPFRNAAKQSAMNTAINAQNADEAAGNINQLAQLQSGVVTRDPTGKLISPAAEGLRKTPRGENVYAEFDKLKATETFALPRVGERVKAIQEQFGERVAPSLKPTAAVKAAQGLEDVATPVGADAGSKAFIELNPLLKFFEDVKTMPAGDFQTNMQGVGRLLHSSDSRVAKAANSIYAAGMEDLRQAGTPASKALVKAMELHRQNASADELGRMMTSASVAKVGEGGRVVFDPAKLDSLLSRDNWKINNIKGAFKEGELENIKKTLADIYHVKGQIPKKAIPSLPENIQPQSPKSMLSRSGQYAMAAFAAPIMMGLGVLSPRVGLGFGAALGATQLPNLYARLIFKIAQKPKGQTLLRALYLENPPNLNDSAKVGVLLKYLQGEQEPSE